MAVLYLGKLIHPCSSFPLQFILILNGSQIISDLIGLLEHCIFAFLATMHHFPELDLREDASFDQRNGLLKESFEDILNLICRSCHC